MWSGVRCLLAILILSVVAPPSFGQTKSKPATGPKKAETPAKLKQHPSVKQPPAPKPKAAKKRPPGVRGMFEIGQEYYEAGKFVQALNAYDVLLRKYPGHEPAILQLAKTLYRLDRIKDAFNIFSKVNPQHLDPETAYEYAWSFYINKSWEGALYGFQRVPKGHALFDLANYYGGICAIKLKKYEDAEDMLEKAVVLPDKLAKSRSLYIKHVQALRLLQQKSSLAKDRETERQALKDQANGGKKDDKTTAAEPWAHSGSKSITRSAKAKYTTEHQYIDQYGTVETNFDTKIAALEVKSGYLAPLSSATGKDRVTVAGIQLTLAAEDRISKGEEQRILVDESNDDLSRLSSADLGTTDTKSGKFIIDPWFEFPLPENTWIALGGEFNFTYPEFERGNRSGYRKAYTGLSGTLPAYSWGTDMSYAETLNTKTIPTITTTAASANVSGELLSALSGSMTVGHEIYDYLDASLSLDGPDSTTSTEMVITQALPASSSIAVLGSYAYLGNYLFYGIPTFGQLGANGQELTAKITASSSPFPWFTITISQLFKKTKWELDNEAAKETFERNVADYVEKFSASASINLFY